MKQLLEKFKHMLSFPRRRESRDWSKVTVEEFDKIFDEGKEDIMEYLDISTARRPGREE
jgi:hypothetical protein